MSAADSLNYLQVQENPDIVKRRIWNHSGRSNREFMRSPLLHVGTQRAAVQIMSGNKTIHKMRVHPDARIHNEVFPDASANAIHFTHSLMNKQLPPVTIANSLPRELEKVNGFIRPEGFKTFMEMAEQYGVHRGLEALNQGKVIAYENMIEDPGAISLMVPNPNRNLRHLMTGPAHTYEFLPPSNTTEEHKKLYRQVMRPRYKDYDVREVYGELGLR